MGDLTAVKFSLVFTFCAILVNLIAFTIAQPLIFLMNILQFPVILLTTGIGLLLHLILPEPAFHFLIVLPLFFPGGTAFGIVEICGFVLTILYWYAISSLLYSAYRLAKSKA